MRVVELGSLPEGAVDEGHLVETQPVAMVDDRGAALAADRPLGREIAEAPGQCRGRELAGDLVEQDALGLAHDIARRSGSCRSAKSAKS